ncbi:MAG TPA: hypothetical protein VGJ34_03845 [Gaiellaceae bacterium]|jgi:hypothetical protein
MNVQRSNLLKAFLVVLVVAAVAAPAGLGQDFRSPDTREAAKAAQLSSVTDLRSPDTRDAAKAAQPTSVMDLSSPDTQDAAKGRQFAGPTIEVVTVEAPSSFHWIDAGIGAASALGASLIGAGLLLVLKRRRPVAVA